MNNTQRFMIEVNANEYCLLAAMRLRFRHKEVTVMMRDGVPQFIVRAFDSEMLDKPPKKLPPIPDLIDDKN